MKVIAGITNADDLAEKIKELEQGFATPVQTAPGEEFGELLKRAVKRRLSPRSCHKVTASTNDEETFTQTLTRICKAKAKGVRVTRS